MFSGLAAFPLLICLVVMPICSIVDGLKAVVMSVCVVSMSGGGIALDNLHCNPLFVLKDGLVILDR